MCSAATCRLCALPPAGHLESGPHMVLIAALDAGTPGELWIVPRRHLRSCLEARSSEWLEVLAMVELAQQHPPIVSHEGRYRLEIAEPAASDPSPPHLCIRLVPDLI